MRGTTVIQLRSDHADLERFGPWGDCASGAVERTPAGVRGACTCGWRGPLRTDDPSGFGWDRADVDLSDHAEDDVEP